MNIENKKSLENAGAKEKYYFKKDVNPMCGNFTGVQRKLAIQNSIFVRSKFICYSTKESFFKSFPFSREDNQRKALHCTEVRRAPLIDFQKMFLNNVFFRWKLFRKFKFYILMTISGI